MSANNPEKQERVMDIIRDCIQDTKTDFNALAPENAGFLVEIEMKIQPIIDRLQAERDKLQEQVNDLICEYAAEKTLRDIGNPAPRINWEEARSMLKIELGAAGGVDNWMLDHILTKFGFKREDGK